MSASESALLRRIMERSASLGDAMGGALEIGPGDDCAALRVGGSTLLLTVDQLVEGRHYTPDTPADLVARKCVARSVSDIAAMGGTPLAALATGALRDDFDREDELFDALHAWARRMGSPLIGGDIARTPGPTVLTCAVLGLPHSTRGPVRRDGARAGDGVYVVGRIGNSFRSGRHLTFVPQVDEGRWLCDALGGALHAMMDISDGLGRDAARIAEASGVCLELDASHIPLHADASGWREAIAEGEDYVLLFTAAASPGDACPITGAPVTRLGTVIAAERGAPACAVVAPDGEWVDASDFGWDHRGA